MGNQPLHYKITDLKPGVRRPERVTVFLDGKFAFSLDLTQVLEATLKVGLERDADRRAELERASDFGKLYTRTLEWVLMRPRSIKETHEHLRLKRRQKSYSYTDEDIEIVIGRLTQKGYLNDQNFARWFVENRNVKKGTSLRRLRQELSAKGIDGALIDELLAETGRSDEAEIKKIIAKRAQKTTPEKLIAYLVRQGFPYDLSKSLVLETD